MRVIEAFKEYTDMTSCLALDRTHLQGDKVKLERSADRKTIQKALEHLRITEIHYNDIGKYHQKFGYIGKVVIFLNLFIGNAFAVSKTEKIAAEVRKLVESKKSQVNAAPEKPKKQKVVKESEPKRSIEATKEEEFKLSAIDQAERNLYDKLVQISLDDVERDKFIEYFDEKLKKYQKEEIRIKILEISTLSIQLIQDLNKPKEILIKLNETKTKNAEFIDFLMKAENLEAEISAKLEIEEENDNRKILKIK